MGGFPRIFRRSSVVRNREFFGGHRSGPTRRRGCNYFCSKFQIILLDIRPGRDTATTDQAATARKITDVILLGKAPSAFPLDNLAAAVHRGRTAPATRRDHRFRSILTADSNDGWFMVPTLYVRYIRKFLVGSALTFVRADRSPHAHVDEDGGGVLRPYDRGAWPMWASDALRVNVGRTGRTRSVPQSF